MSYTTVGLVRLALVPGISDPEQQPNETTRTAGDLNNAQLEDAIAEADAQIDTYLGRRYVTPVAPQGDPLAIPHPVDYWSRNIAAYNATLTFRKGQDIEDNDPVVRRWKVAMDALTMIATGKATLSIPENSGPTGAGGAGEVFNPNNGVMFPMQDFDLVRGGFEDFGPGRWYGPGGF